MTLAKLHRLSDRLETLRVLRERAARRMNELGRVVSDVNDRRWQMFSDASVACAQYASLVDRLEAQLLAAELAYLEARRCLTH